jgi:vanillate/3-O-methylgallate O-demethylase
VSRPSLDDLVRARSPVDLLRGSPTGPYAFPVVPPEFTNWRDEQRAWREGCALFDLSYHLTELQLEGPGTAVLLSHLGVSDVVHMGADRAKQFIACNDDGCLIGDAILFPLGNGRFSLVGRPPAANWVQFHAETGNWRVTTVRDERTAVRGGPRRRFRYQLQGPLAPDVMRRATGRPAPDVRFFGLDTVTIAGQALQVLRHGMVGQPGWEIVGPWAHGEAVRDALLDAGRDIGLQPVGSRAYPTTTLESGWIPSPLPAIYTGEKMRSYRQWLSATSYEATASLGGSFVSDDITDYYVNPYELGYGPFIAFDRPFVGCQALERMASGLRRRKVTLVWHPDDIAGVFRSLLREGSDPAKYIDLPLANYATLPYDAVRQDDRTVGVSTYTGYSYNERVMLSLAIVDTEQSLPGTQVTVVWGEGATARRPSAERHVQAAIRATVAPVPYSTVAREMYRNS